MGAFDIAKAPLCGKNKNNALLYSVLVIKSKLVHKEDIYDKNNKRNIDSYRCVRSNNMLTTRNSTYNIRIDR